MIETEIEKADIEWLISLLVTIWLAKKRKSPKRKTPRKHKR